jgi:tetratricopeptide (TPR) repeat protein
MPIDLNSFDLTYHFNEALREVFNSPSDVESACDALKNHLVQLEDVDSASALEEQAQTLAQLGGFQRGLGKLNEGEDSLTRSLELFQAIGASPTRLIAARIRLAHVFHWQEKFPEAEALFHACLEELEQMAGEEALKSFALQHLGKCYFDQARFEEAAQCFTKALELRTRLDQRELIESSRHALDQTLKAMSKPR